MRGELAPSRLFSRWFVLVFAASIASELTHSLFLHVPRFMLEVDADERFVGRVAGLAGVAGLMVRPGVGWLMNHRSRRIVVRIGTGLLCLTALGYSTITAAGASLGAVRVVQGVADGMSYSAFFAYVADRVPDHRRTQGLAVFGISGLAPIGLGTTLGDVILGFAGYERLFLVAAVFSLVSFLMTFTLDSNNSRGGEAPPGGFTTVLRRRDLRPIWVATGALSLSFSVAFVFVATFVERQGLGVVSPFFVAYAGVAVLLRLGLGSLPDRVGPHRMVMPSLLAYAAGFATLAIVPSLTGLVVAGALGGVGHGFSFPVLLGLATGRAGPVDRASATAVFTALLDAGSFVFAPALGWVIAGWGYPAGFGGAIGGIVLILAVFSLLERRRG